MLWYAVEISVIVRLLLPGIPGYYIGKVIATHLKLFCRYIESVRFLVQIVQMTTFLYFCLHH